MTPWPPVREAGQPPPHPPTSRQPLKTAAASISAGPPRATTSASPATKSNAVAAATAATTARSRPAAPPHTPTATSATTPTTATGSVPATLPATPVAGQAAEAGALSPTRLPTATAPVIQFTLVTDPDSQQTLTCDDGDGHVAETVPAVGVAANSLTPDSCPTSYPSDYGDRLATDATTYEYDALGDQTTITSPAPAGQTGSETTTNDYDPAGQLTSTTRPADEQQRRRPEPGDRLHATTTRASSLPSRGRAPTTAAESMTSYCYDPDGDRTAVVAAGREHLARSRPARQLVAVPDQLRLSDRLQLRLPRRARHRRRARRRLGRSERPDDAATPMTRPATC